DRSRRHAALQAEHPAVPRSASTDAPGAAHRSAAGTPVGRAPQRRALRRDLRSREPRSGRDEEIRSEGTRPGRRRSVPADRVSNEDRGFPGGRAMRTMMNTRSMKAVAGFALCLGAGALLSAQAETGQTAMDTAIAKAAATTATTADRAAEQRIALPET